MTEKPQRMVLTVDEASVCLGLSRGLTYEAIRRGDIPSIRIGRRILVPRAALLEMLRQGYADSSVKNNRATPSNRWKE